jgi:hypothetical protein
MTDVSEADFKTESTVFQIGMVPRRIDSITKIDGVSFADAYPRAEIVELDGIPVR